MGALLRCIIVLFQVCVFVTSKNVVRMSIKGDDTKGFFSGLDNINQAPVKSQDVAFSFAKHFQNNMVLQRAPAKANIYGFSPDIGQKVILQMTTATKPYYYTTHIVEGSTKGVGVWMITLDPMEANTTASIKVMSERGTLHLNNLIFGDVWICSGQSNMQFAVHQMDRHAEEMADAHNYPNIRLFTPTMKYSTTAMDDLIEVEENWSLPNNDTVGHSDWTYFSAVCWVYGKAIHKALNVPIGLVASDYGGTAVRLWSSPDVIDKCGIVKNGWNSQCWNSMIHPLLKMTIYGVVWYQGESDISGPSMNQYNCTFPAMIEDWRAKFSQASKTTSPSFPFGFVQLAPRNDNNQTITQGFPDIRWHQTADVGYVPNPKMKNVFMAVAMDLPDFKSPWNGMHPRFKIDVGSRLALSGLGIAYNKNEVFQGPFPTSGSWSGSGYKITYGPSTKLQVLSKEGFEFLCEPSSGAAQWVPTVITNSTTNTVTLDAGVCKNGEQHIGLRYAWRETPCAFKKCAIYESVNSLPGPPFSLNVKPGESNVKFTSPYGDGVLTF